MIATIGKVIETPGSLTIQTARPDAENLSDTVTVLWQDCRTISPEQRRKAWALIGEIAAATGYIGQGDKSDLNTMLKAEFLRARIDKLQAEAIKAFSLSDVDMTTARLYIDWLVEFCVVNDIPTKQPLVEYAEDIGAYIYACVMHKQCAVCGRRPSDLHHWERVGMGADRTEINHIGLMCEPLCRVHHTECHTMAQAEFDEKYHIYPIKIDEKIAKLYKLGRKSNEQADNHRKSDARR